MSSFAAFRYTLYTVGGGTVLYAFISPSSELPAYDPNRNDSQRNLVLQHIKKSAEAYQSSYNKPLEIKTESDNPGRAPGQVVRCSRCPGADDSVFVLAMGLPPSCSEQALPCPTMDQGQLSTALSRMHPRPVQAARAQNKLQAHPAPSGHVQSSPYTKPGRLKRKLNLLGARPKGTARTKLNSRQIMLGALKVL